MAYSCKEAVQPTQNVTNLQARGGSRTICKTPVLYRMSLRARHEVEDWESNMTGDFDTAGKGKSALIAAAHRNLEAEVYTFTEEQVIGVCQDMAKFFDPIDMPILINKAIGLGFPILDMALTMHQQSAP